MPRWQGAMGKGDGKWKGGFKGGQAGPAAEPCWFQGVFGIKGSQGEMIRQSAHPHPLMLRTTHLKFL